MSELLPCPFCGSSDVYEPAILGSSKVRCRECCAEELTHIWNTRPTPEPEPSTEAAGFDEQVFAEWVNELAGEYVEPWVGGNVARAVAELLAGQSSSLPDEPTPAMIHEAVEAYYAGDWKDCDEMDHDCITAMYKAMLKEHRATGGHQ